MLLGSPGRGAGVVRAGAGVTSPGPFLILFLLSLDPSHRVVFGLPELENQNPSAISGDHERH